MWKASLKIGLGLLAMGYAFVAHAEDDHHLLSLRDQFDQKYLNNTQKPLGEVQSLLQKNHVKLSSDVVVKTLAVLQCVKKHKVAHNNILTIIDYSLPSNQKRFWVFDLAKNQLLYHTYVSHGIKSGALLTTYFSNRMNSKASSLGLYRTQNAYRGRHGFSLKLIGLDKGFNDRAYHRFIVMHGAWYVGDHFIKKYGRPGRSWGCPALPKHLTKGIIDTIKNNSLMIVYSQKHQWFQKSKFLNCSDLMHTSTSVSAQPHTSKPAELMKLRGKVLFVDINNNNKREVQEPVMAMAVSDYERLVNTKVPVDRILRRQINKREYVALNLSEFMKMYSDQTKIKAVVFVIPLVKKIRGYWHTEIKILKLGSVKSVQPKNPVSDGGVVIQSYSLSFEGKPSVNLKSTKRFIRWLGL